MNLIIPSLLTPPILAFKSFRLNCKIFFPLSDTISFLAIRIAIPSTIADLPTPPSPNKTTLFLSLRVRTISTLRISSSRPITSINSPFLAFKVISAAISFNNE